jgi:polyhydroxyalkanoate synthase
MIAGIWDPANLGGALVRAAMSTSRRPGKAARVLASLGMQGATAAAAWARGAHTIDRDKRFADPAWEGNPYFACLHTGYRLLTDFARDWITAAEVDPLTAHKARFAVELLTDLLAPTNFAGTNPAVIKRAFDTGGASLLAGLRNWWDDQLHNSGQPRQVDTTGFTIGHTLAATPCEVVHRNELMELLYFPPQCATAYPVPLVFSPPWINKYYVLDLAPGRSLIEYAVQRGHPVFCISYRNPDESLRNTSLEDYLVHGLLEALTVATESTKAPRVNLAGLCLGGVLATMATAWDAANGADRVASLTLLNTMLDYSDPGVLGCFTDEATIGRIESSIQERGYLDGHEMAGTFDAIRANDLIFSGVVRNWLLGECAPAFDILAWNADSTRMPARMHANYLRSCYRDNQLARGDLVAAGHRLDLSRIAADAYVVSARNDHIVPWTSAYQSTRLLGGASRFVLSSGGHIAGVVNPPTGKATHIAATADLPSPAQWLADREEVAGSWWVDWVTWLAQRSGTRRRPGGWSAPAPMAPGPGAYVLG